MDQCGKYHVDYLLHDKSQACRLQNIILEELLKALHRNNILIRVPMNLLCVFLALLLLLLIFILSHILETTMMFTLKND